MLQIRVIGCVLGQTPGAHRAMILNSERYLVLRTEKLLTFTVWHQVVHFILLESTEKILVFTVRHLIVHCIFLEL